MARRPSLGQRIAAARCQRRPAATVRRVTNVRRTAVCRQVRAAHLVGRGRGGMRRAAQRGPVLVVQSHVPTSASVLANAPSLRIRVDVILPILLFLFSLVQNMADVGDTVFHPDESRWLNRAHYLTDLRDPFGSTWADQYLTRGQPPLGSYLMGLGLLVQGRDTETTAVWDFAYGLEWNEQAGAMPEDADLFAGRRINAVVGALVVLVVYFVAREFTNRAGAALGAAFLAFHPLHIWLSSQALSDQLLNLLVALATLAAIWYARRPSWPRAMVLGVLLGLGGATKLSPMLLSLPLAGLGAFLVIRSFTRYASRTRPTDLSMGVQLLALPPVAFAVFVVSYPYLWPAPIRRTFNLFELRAQEMAGQAQAWPDVAVDSRAEAFARIGERLTEQFSTSGRLVALAAQTIGVNWEPHGRDFIPVLIGVLLFAALVVRTGLRSPAGLAAIVLASQAGAIIVGLRADFYRYHLPIVLLMSICIALTAGALVRLLARLEAWRWLSFLPGVSLSAPVVQQPPAAKPDRRWRRPRARTSSERGRAARPASRLGTVLHGK